MLNVLVLRDEDCPACDRVVRAIEDMQEELPELRLEERLMDDAEDLADWLGASTTPAVVVNNQLALQGHVQDEQIHRYLDMAAHGHYHDPFAIPEPGEVGQAAMGHQDLGTQDPEWRGSGRRPGFGSSPGGRH
jgi:glutaredoxin